MEKTFSTNAGSSNLLLIGNILLASLNNSGRLDYVINALLGGAIYLGYRELGNYLERRRKNKAA